MTRVLIVEDQRMAQENMESIIKASENYTLANATAQATDSGLLIKGNEEKNESIGCSG